MSEIEKMLGKIAVRVTTDEETRLKFEFNDGSSMLMYHDQDCCESVTIEDIDGSLHDLLNHRIILAEEVSNSKWNDEDTMSETWTFYKIATIKGGVTIRWYGSSNGYYSESVDIEWDDEQ